MGIYDIMEARKRARQWLQDWPVGKIGLLSGPGMWDKARMRVTGHPWYKGWPLLSLELEDGGDKFECPYGLRDRLVAEVKEVSGG